MEAQHCHRKYSSLKPEVLNQEQNLRNCKRKEYGVWKSTNWTVHATIPVHGLSVVGNELLVGHLDGMSIYLREEEWGQNRAVQTNPEHMADQSLAVPRNSEHAADSDLSSEMF
ncbi:hypothetical protein J6590_062501 [Homalodisca vitripennis]|nr:hypothetical protein J6590_062501 [Homalodisca vitripennis]